MRRLSVVFFAILLFTVPVLCQQDFSKVEIKATKVAGNVYMLLAPYLVNSVLD